MEREEKRKKEKNEGEEESESGWGYLENRREHGNIQKHSSM